MQPILQTPNASINPLENEAVYTWEAPTQWLEYPKVLHNLPRWKEDKQLSIIFITNENGLTLETEERLKIRALIMDAEKEEPNILDIKTDIKVQLDTNASNGMRLIEEALRYAELLKTFDINEINPDESNTLKRELFILDQNTETVICIRNEEQEDDYTRCISIQTITREEALDLKINPTHYIQQVTHYYHNNEES